MPPDRLGRRVRRRTWSWATTDVATLAYFYIYKAEPSYDDQVATEHVTVRTEIRFCVDRACRGLPPSALVQVQRPSTLFCCAVCALARAGRQGHDNAIVPVVHRALEEREPGPRVHALVREGKSPRAEHDGQPEDEQHVSAAALRHAVQRDTPRACHRVLRVGGLRFVSAH